MRDYNQELGKSRFKDIKTFMHKGYLYDMPVISHTRKDYTTFTTNSLVLNISDTPVE